MWKMLGQVVLGVLAALGMVLVVFVGYLYDKAEYERRAEERRRSRRKGDVK